MLLFISLKNIIFILGIILLLRFIGKMMSARKNINDQKKHVKNKTQVNYEKDKAKRNLGKTTIQKIDKSKVDDAEYSEFEEVD